MSPEIAPVLEAILGRALSRRFGLGASPISFSSIEAFENVSWSKHLPKNGPGSDQRRAKRGVSRPVNFVEIWGLFEASDVLPSGRKLLA